MSCLALAHGIVCERLAGVGVDDFYVHVLVIDYEYIPAVIVEQPHAVIVVTEGEFLAIPGPTRGLVELDGARPHRLSPLSDDMPAIPLRNSNRVEAVGSHGIESKAVGSGEGGNRFERPEAHEEGGTANQEAPS